MRSSTVRISKSGLCRPGHQSGREVNRIEGRDGFRRKWAASSLNNFRLIRNTLQALAKAFSSLLRSLASLALEPTGSGRSEQRAVTLDKRQVRRDDALCGREQAVDAQTLGFQQQPRQNCA